MIVWGCITWQEVENAADIDDGINGNLYLQISMDELLNTL